MQTFLILSFFALAVGAVVWLIIVGRQRQKQQDFERRVQARKLGWDYHGERDGRIDYRFSGGGDGIEWSMWYDSDRGDKSPTPRAYWRTANVRAPRLSLVIIGSKRYQMESGPVARMFMDIVSGAVQAVGREDRVVNQADKSEFYESAITLDEGRATFRDRYTVAVSPDMLRGWLDEELQRLLLNWPQQKRGARYQSDEKIEIALRADGLQIVAQQMPEAFEFWKHLAQLGEALAQRLSRLAH